jgi:hypothetical protein
LLEVAIAGGIQYYGQLTDNPAFASIADDPRMESLQATMVANINEDRELLGLDPI